MAVGHPDDRLFEVAVAEANRAQHRAVWRAGDAVGNQTGAAVRGGRSHAVVLLGSAILAAGARAIQCRRGAPVILCGYGTTGIVAVAVFLGRRRAVAFRARGRRAAYLTAAAIPAAPRPGAAPRAGAVRPQAAARRAHARRNALVGRGAAPARAARTHGAGSARHGARRRGAPAHRLRLARRLRRAARIAESVQIRAPRYCPRAARDA